MTIIGEAQSLRPVALLPFRVNVTLTAGVVTGVLAVFVSGCGGSSSNATKPNGIQSKDAGLGYNARTEIALGHTINPAMARAGERIVRFAGRHPKLTTKTVGKRIIYLTVRATSEYEAPEGGRAVTRDILKLATRPTPDESPDLDAVLALAVSRFSRSAEHPDNNFYSAIALYAPGGAELPVGEGNSHIAGWSAQERERAGPASGPSIKPQYDSSGAQLARGKSLYDPLTAAKNVDAHLPNLIAFIENDFGSARRRGDGRMMP